jgi:hypothetical protein
MGDYDMSDIALPKGSAEDKDVDAAAEDEDACDAAIDAAMASDGDPGTRREAFKSAVLKIVEQYGK